MTHLGALGTPAEDVDAVTFDYFGETINANAGLSELDYVDFLEVAGTADIDGPDAVRLVKSFARMCIAAEDFDRFWATAKKNRQGMDALFKVLTTIVEVVSDRPTVRLSSSADTPTTADTNSAAVVSSTLAERLEGRPDLALVVRRSAEAQAAKAG